ncbi:MAG TPA: hypothetical protein PK669_04370 [Methanosarcina thermophila]|uniref:hypothetical protein n=1 Tax=Methanosarcina thermophila TaxID=2210 RepID=UPI0011E5EFC6|nr:hypothetical protein [Methanosarcina thermophila]NLU57269.1 hypothetical protein [Methanosarcina thermophila]HOA67962.1 hypothetical protein [Methanosarcina thermophila]HOQ66134.1 hypothetical protein [Methanosarcina thermophila]HPT81303.1 hypothetical protein [Methanosarcina thermophila]HPZ19533.1 hypothetical protein [Methanosarcina thermophila]
MKLSALKITPYYRKRQCSIIFISQQLISNSKPPTQYSISMSSIPLYFANYIYHPKQIKYCIKVSNLESVFSNNATPEDQGWTEPSDASIEVFSFLSHFRSSVKASRYALAGDPI